MDVQEADDFPYTESRPGRVHVQYWLPSDVARKWEWMLAFSKEYLAPSNNSKTQAHVALINTMHAIFVNRVADDLEVLKKQLNDSQGEPVNAPSLEA